jgi:hypothetical protein
LAVGFKVHFLWYPIGTGSFLHSFFSTISYHLEPEGWGRKYPYLMKDLYNGKIDKSLLPKLLKEINEIQSLLKNYSLDKVVWDIEDLSKQPPWGDKISPDITSLSNY